MPENTKENEYISLAKAAGHCPYSQDYLSLRARQGKLKSIKLGRNWVTTREWVEDYVQKSQQFFEKRMPKQAERAEQREQNGLQTAPFQEGKIPVVEISGEEEEKGEEKGEEEEREEKREEEKEEEKEKEEETDRNTIMVNKIDKKTSDKAILNKERPPLFQKPALSTGLVIALAFFVLIFSSCFLGDGFIYEAKVAFEQGTRTMARGLATIETALEDYWLPSGQAGLVAIDYQHSVFEETFKVFGEYFQWLGQGVVAIARDLMLQSNN